MGKPNKIRMRLVPAPWDEPSHKRAAIEVEIDGRGLPSIVSGASAGEASGEPTAPADVLWPGRELWLGHLVEADEDYDPDGRAPVLVCACGLYGCGGVGARVEVADSEVRWSDFVYAPSRASIDIGPFRFREADYRRQIEAVMLEWRRDWGER